MNDLDKNPNKKREKLATKLKEWQSEQSKTYQIYIKTSAVGLEFGLSIVIGALLGYFADKYFASSPYGLLIGLLIGSIAAGKRLWLFMKIIWKRIAPTTTTMTKMNEDAKKDLVGYIKKTKWSAAILLSIIVLLLVIAYAASATSWLGPLSGAVIGVLVATGNMFAIGYAFYVLAITGGKRRVILWPVASFAGMGVLAYLLATAMPALIMGFAIGLTAPVIFGAVLVFLE